MKKLNKEDVAGLPILKKGRRTRVNVQLSQLKPGEGAEIKKQTDWIGKRPPYQLINRFAKRHGWKLQTTRSPDDTGWIVVRME